MTRRGHSQYGRGRLAALCADISVIIATCLPLLVPFDISRNIDLQGSLLIVVGVFAWSAVLLRRRTMPSQLELILIGVFMMSCVLSLLANPHLGYDFFGAPYIRLGAAGLLACVGFGLLLTAISIKRLVTWLYLIIVGLSVVSVPYSWLHFHSLSRIGGVFSQADIFACFVGCGLLFGLEMLHLYPKQRKILLSVQFFWVVLLLLTQTRAVLLITIVLWLVWELQRQRDNKFKRVGLYLVGALLLLGGLHYLAPSRLTNTTYASQSINYRLTLQDYALRASWHKPMLGYGPGNLADALSCSRLPAATLQKTCHQGYFFNSSHNIFIDRVLAIGWLGGLSYLVIVLLAIYRGLNSGPQTRIFGYTLLLVACYYLTNVTSVTLELLLWILVLKCLHAGSKTLDKP